MINKDLLLKIRRHILVEPLRLNMSSYFLTKRLADPLRRLLGRHAGEAKLYDRGRSFQYPSCNTVACIAGWACILSGNTLPTGYDSVARLAEEVLGLSILEAHDLFHGWYNTPTYMDASVEKRAQMAVKRMDDLVAAHERDTGINA